MPTCLVTGVAGFIGSNLARKLISEGWKVYGIDNFSTGKKENIPEGCEFYERDITYVRDTLSVLNHTRPEIIFHLAAIPRVQYSIKEPLITNRSNTQGTLAVLEAAKQSDTVKRVIYSSSSSVYGDQEDLPLVETMNPNPISPYAAQKLSGEYYCKVYSYIHNLETISLRYFNVFGYGQDPNSEYSCLIPKFIRILSQKGEAIIYGDGEQTRDFTAISDVVDANIAASIAPKAFTHGDIFNIGAGRARSVNDVAGLISSLLPGGTIKHTDPVPEPKHTYANITKARECLKWEPKASFEDVMKETIQWITK